MGAVIGDAQRLDLRRREVLRHMHRNFGQFKEMSCRQAQVPNHDYVLAIAYDWLHPAKGFYRCRDFLDGGLSPLARVLWIRFRAVNGPPCNRESGFGRYGLPGVHKTSFCSSWRNTSPI